MEPMESLNVAAAAAVCLFEQRRRRMCALARAGDLVGSVKRLPPDLSTNPKHLKGFGL